MLDEIGINLGEQMVAAPGKQPAAAVAQQEAAPEAMGIGSGAAAGGGEGDGIDDDLQARLNNLRRT